MATSMDLIGSVVGLEAAAVQIHQSGSLAELITSLKTLYEQSRTTWSHLLQEVGCPVVPKQCSIEDLVAAGGLQVSAAHLRSLEREPDLRDVQEMLQTCTAKSLKQLQLAARPCLELIPLMQAGGIDCSGLDIEGFVDLVSQIDDVQSINENQKMQLTQMAADLEHQRNKFTSQFKVLVLAEKTKRFQSDSRMEDTSDLFARKDSDTFSEGTTPRSGRSSVRTGMSGMSSISTKSATQRRAATLKAAMQVEPWMREWYHVVRHDLEEQTAVLRSLEDEEESPQVMRILSLCTKHEQLKDLIAVYREGLEACEEQFPEHGTLAEPRQQVEEAVAAYRRSVQPAFDQCANDLERLHALLERKQAEVKRRELELEYFLHESNQRMHTNEVAQQQYFVEIEAMTKGLQELGEERHAEVLRRVQEHERLLEARAAAHGMLRGIAEHETRLQRAHELFQLQMRMVESMGMLGQVLYREALDLQMEGYQYLKQCKKWIADHEQKCINDWNKLWAKHGKRTIQGELHTIGELDWVGKKTRQEILRYQREGDAASKSVAETKMTALQVMEALRADCLSRVDGLVKQLSDNLPREEANRRVLLEVVMWAQSQLAEHAVPDVSYRVPGMPEGKLPPPAPEKWVTDPTARIARHQEKKNCGAVDKTLLRSRALACRAFEQYLMYEPNRSLPPAPDYGTYYAELEALNILNSEGPLHVMRPASAPPPGTRVARRPSTQSSSVGGDLDVEVIPQGLMKNESVRSVSHAKADRKRRVQMRAVAAVS